MRHSPEVTSRGGGDISPRTSLLVTVNLEVPPSEPIERVWFVDAATRNGTLRWMTPGGRYGSTRQ